MINHNQLIGIKFGNLEVVGVGPTNHHRKKMMIVRYKRWTDVTI